MTNGAVIVPHSSYVLGLQFEPDHDAEQLCDSLWNRLAIGITVARSDAKPQKLSGSGLSEVEGDECRAVLVRIHHLAMGGQEKTKGLADSPLRSGGSFGGLPVRPHRPWFSSVPAATGYSQLRSDGSNIHAISAYAIAV